MDVGHSARISLGRRCRFEWLQRNIIEVTSIDTQYGVRAPFETVLRFRLTQIF